MSPFKQPINSVDLNISSRTGSNTQQILISYRFSFVLNKILPVFNFFLIFVSLLNENKIIFKLPIISKMQNDGNTFF